MKALPINVFRSNTGDCSNNGITNRYDRLLLVCKDGYIEVDEANPPENLVQIVTRCGGYKCIEPVAKTAPGSVGWMSGGTFAYTCDSRFHEISDYPLSVHDRQETQEQYYWSFD